MNSLRFMAWIAIAVAMGAAMTKSTGDVAVGIALGAGIATALVTGSRRGDACCGFSPRREE